MLRNFLLTAFRNLWKHKFYSAINLVGLGMGMALCMFIFTIIHREYTYDQGHNDSERIFRVVRTYYGSDQVEYQGIIPYPFGHAIRSEVSGFEYLSGLHGPARALVSYTDQYDQKQVISQWPILYVEPDYFKIFNYDLPVGNPERLQEPNVAFITRETARKYFGSENPLGQKITVDPGNGGKHSVVIEGILANTTNKLQFPFDIVVSLSSLKQVKPALFKENWSLRGQFNCFVKLPEAGDQVAFESRLNQLLKQKLTEDPNVDRFRMSLQPISQMHTDARYDGGDYTTPAPVMGAFIFLALVALATVCLNYINLSTAHAIKRHKEIGIRKTMGAGRSLISAQFLTETFVLVVIASAIAFTIGQVLLDRLNWFIPNMPFTITYENQIFLFTVILIFAVTVMAGVIPSLHLSAKRPVQILNLLNRNSGKSRAIGRNWLVASQFFFTNFFVVAIIVITSQIQLMQNISYGFAVENTAVIDCKGMAHQEIERFAQELRHYPFIAGVSVATNQPLSSSNHYLGYSLPGATLEDRPQANIKFVDEHYLAVYGIPLLQGRNVSASSEALIIDKLASQLGIDEEKILGHKMTIGNEVVKIIGVIKDFESHLSNSNPEILVFDQKKTDKIHLAFSGKANPEKLKEIEASFHQHFPESLYQLKTIEEIIKSFHSTSNGLLKLLILFGVFSVIVSMIGLYGLVSYLALRHQKNIGIRKVFGANIYDILLSFSRRYIIILVLSFGLVLIPSYLLLSEWVNGFALRIKIGYEHYLTAFAISFLLTLLTVSYRSYLAAIRNPTITLRYE